MGEGRSTSTRPLLRTIREEPQVSAAIDAAALRFKRCHDAIDALKWALARDPTGGTKLEQGPGYVQSMRGATSIELPSITVLYTVEEHTITLHAMRFFPL